MAEKKSQRTVLNDVVIRYRDENENEQASERRKNHGEQYYPAAPGSPCDTRESLQGVSRWRRHGQMASAQRLYWQGSPHGCQGRRHLQDVVHQFQYRQESLLRRRIS